MHRSLVLAAGLFVAMLVLSAPALAAKPADLRVKAVSDPPATAAPGGAINATDSTKNFGKKRAKASTTRFYLSTDGRLDSGDRVIGGSRKVPALRGGRTSRGSSALTLPADTTGTFSLLACADDLGKVKESKEANNCRASSAQIDIAGTPLIAISPPSNAFGSVVTGSSSAPVVFTITNTGNGESGALSLVRSGADRTQFQVGADGCSGVILAAGTSCTVAVSFSPTSTGAKSASLAASATPGGSAAAALNGTGLAPASLAVTPGSHGFGSQNVGGSTGPFSFTITNTGGSTSGPLNTSITGTNPTQFGLSNNNCDGVSLAAGDSCTVDTTFSPATSEAKTASLEVSGTPGGTATASLSGTGISPASLSISPINHSFGSSNVGVPTAFQTFTVTNVGGVATTMMSVSVTGTDNGQFQVNVVTDLCDGQTLAPATSCTVEARFAPTSMGAKSATLSVSATSGGSANSSLLGTGT